MGLNHVYILTGAGTYLEAVERHEAVSAPCRQRAAGTKPSNGNNNKNAGAAAGRVVDKRFASIADADEVPNPGSMYRNRIAAIWV